MNPRRVGHAIRRVVGPGIGAANNSTTSPLSGAAFLRHARAAARHRHPHDVYRALRRGEFGESSSKQRRQVHGIPICPNAGKRDEKVLD